MGSTERAIGAQMNQTILARGLQSRYACVFFYVLFISNLPFFSHISFSNFKSSGTIIYNGICRVLV